MIFICHPHSVHQKSFSSEQNDKHNSLTFHLHISSLQIIPSHFFSLLFYEKVDSLRRLIRSFLWTIFVHLNLLAKRMMTILGGNTTGRWLLASHRISLRTRKLSNHCMSFIINSITLSSVSRVSDHLSGSII